MLLKFVLVLVIIGNVLSQQEEGEKRPDGEKKLRQMQNANYVLKSIEGIQMDASERPPPERGSNDSFVLIIVNGYMARGRFAKNKAEFEMTLRQEWADTRLKVAGNGRVLIRDPSKIWLPDTFFDTADEITKSSDPHQRFVRLDVEENHITYSQRYTLKMQCSPASSAFPIKNRLLCKLKLGSWGYPIDDLLYIWRNNPITFNDAEGAFEQFELISSETGQCRDSYITGEFSCVYLDMLLGAPLHEPIFHFYLPSIFLLFASWLHFWLNKRWAIVRALSAFVPFVAFAILMFFLDDPSMPFVTAHEIWLVICLLFAFLSILEYAFCLYVGDFGRDISDDGELKGLLNERQEVSREKKRKVYPNLPISDGLSRILFPVLFLIVFAIYLVIFALI